MATPSFLQLLEYTGLLAYQDRLHDNGFDDVDALCDMTKDDLAKLSITAIQWETLDKIFSGIRSMRATTLLSAGHLSTDQGLISPVFVPTALDQDPDMIASNQMPERSLPLGSEVVVSASTWTSLTKENGYIQHLLSLYFCWEYPIFASLSKDHFIKDFREGRNRYCSSMLVNALLALGYCFSSQKIVTGTSQAPLPSGDQFFEESQRLLDAETDRQSLITVQTLGILSLRESSCGRDTQSSYYAEQSIRLAVEMGLHCNNPSMDGDETSVTIATFWGAFGLHHHSAWALLATSLPSCSSSFKSLMPPKPTRSPEKRDVWAPYTNDDLLNPQPCAQNWQNWHTGQVFNCICELSELIHESLYFLIRHVNPPTRKDLLSLYAKYLS
ncbi:unnamed protein product, partial [Clonostachys chloroleuca]